MFCFHGFLGSGVFTKASYSSSSNGTYMLKRAISSDDREKSAAENYLYQINGTSVSSSGLFSRNVKALDACDDEYGGVVVDPDRLPVNPAAFASMLRFSLSRWKMTVIFGHCLNNSYVAEIYPGYPMLVGGGAIRMFVGYPMLVNILTSNYFILPQGKKGVWLKLPLERSELVPVAVKVTSYAQT